MVTNIIVYIWCVWFSSGIHIYKKIHMTENYETRDV